MKKISIIIPVYNTEEYLKKCLDSVVNQTYNNLEIIVINDGSKGNTDKIIEKYNDNRIKYFKRTNHGIGATRNYGISKSSGDYICFLDSDDYIELDALEKMIIKAIQDNLDIVVTDYFEYHESRKVKKEVKLVEFNNTSLKDKANLINELNLGSSNKLFNNKLFSNNKFPEKIKYEDFALVLKLFDQANLIGKINKPLFTFNKREKSETLTIDERVFDIFVSLDEIKNYFKNRFTNEINYFIVKTCVLYASKQKYQKNKKIKKDFVEFAYDYIKLNVENYKNNEYFKDYSFIKRTIQKNKFLLKIYINF